MSWAETITNPLVLATILGAGAAFATVMTLAQPLMNNAKVSTKLKQVAKRREELRQKNRAQLESAKVTLARQDANAFMTNIVKRYDLQRVLEVDGLNDKLQRAGLRGPAATTTYYFYRGALPIGLALGAFFYLSVLGFAERFGMVGTQVLVAVVAAAVIGFYAPSLYISNRASKRKEAIMRAFPDSLDMLLICVESGMSIELALQRVGTEIAPASAELAEELQLTTAELSYLPDRRMAFENLAKRTNHPGVKAVAMALVQAEKYGTPLGQALRIMAKENRDLRMNEAEKKAAALPAKLTVPMIVFFLPVLFAVIMGPAMIQVAQMMAD
jgi:tight adherence protein C